VDDYLIEIKENQQPAYARSKKFCSQSCSAKYNNLGKQRNHKGKTCPLCQFSISSDKTFCSQECREIYYSQSKRLPPKTSGKYVISWRQRIKLRAVAYKGGCCQICCYSRSLRALQFHHLNPDKKDFTVSSVCKSWKTIKKEIDKCILLCSNCHAELHDGLISLADGVGVEPTLKPH
jgi:hypothetical protein